MTLQEIQSNLAQKLGYKDWDELIQKSDKEMIDNSWFLVTLDFAKEYGKKCLENAAERMVKNAPSWRQIGGTEASRYHYCLKATITSEENLI